MKNAKRLLVFLLVMVMMLSLCSGSALAAGKGGDRGGKSWGWTKSDEEKNKNKDTEEAVEEVTELEESEEAAESEEVEEVTEPEEVEEVTEPGDDEDFEIPEEAEEADASEELVISDEPEESEELVAPEEELVISDEPEELMIIDYPEASFDSDEVDGVAVHVDAPKGALPAGTTMDVTEVSLEAVQDAVDKADDISGTVVAAVDITFYDADGKTIEPLEDITVTMTSEEIAKIDAPEVVHVDAKADEIENVNVEAEPVEQVEESSAENEVVFEAKDFSVYAVVATAPSSNNQYVIYTGTNAMEHTGNNITLASVTVENNTVVRSSSNNVTFTFTATGGGTPQGYKISFTYPSGYGGTTTRYLRNNNGTLTSTGTQTENGTTWYYDQLNHRLSSGNYYLVFSNGAFTMSTTAAEVYLARVENEPAADALTYYYFNSDGTSSIAASETATPTTQWTNVSSLAKTISGYRFLEARANSPTQGDVITQVNGRYYRQGSETTGTGHTLNSIYFIYIKDYAPGEDVIPGLNGPVTQKHVSEQNPDGTFTIQLDITGVINEVKHGANVVVVFDRTSSMNGTMSSSDRTKRIDAAIAAVDTLVTELNPGDPAVEGQYDIDFALVEFDREAEIYDFGTNGISGHTNWTKSGTALNTRVSRYEDGENLAPSGATAEGGGTNWQAALQQTAAVLANKPDEDPTYVIFMTDGEPTIYIGSTSVTNPTSTNSPEYARSVPYATAIVQAEYHMYDIFCSSSTTTYLESLYQTSGAESYVMAGTQSDLEDAFAAVATAMIAAIGSSEYAADDGVPELGSFDLDTVHGEPQLSEARYYKKAANSTQFTEWADAPVAKPSEAGVEWDLSSVGTLEKDVVYRIEFEVWPSQAAYDLIADLNNQKIYYDYETYQAHGGTKTEAQAIADGEIITADQHAQITKVTDTTYTLKTNTSLSASYKLYGETVTEDGIDFTPQAMDLPTKTISVKKLWPTNMLDEYGAAEYYDEETGETIKATEILLTLMKEKSGEDAGTFEKYLDVLVKASDGWKKDDIYVSCGFMTVKEVNGQKVVDIKETGHDYQLVEPKGFSWYWDLISDVYHPMVINGVDKVLVYKPDLKASDVNNETIFELEPGRIYEVQSSTSGNTLEASNYRRSNLNLTKTLPAADDTALFEYKAKVTDSNSLDGYIWFSAWDPAASDYVYDLDVTGGNVAKETKDIPEGATINEDGTCTWTETTTIIVDDEEVEETNTYTRPIAGDGKYYTGFFFATNGAELTIKIKASWNVRFLNLFHDTTFEFEETGMPGNYEFDKVAAATRWPIKLQTNQDWYTIVTGSTTGKITGTITEPNNQYTVTYTNKPKPEFYIYHSSVAGDGDLETIPMSAVNADGTYNLYAKAKAGTLYGGYYLDYNGKGTYADDGVKGKDGIAYTGMNNEWSGAETLDGREMKPVAGETYYIKEVPTYYLRNYHQINYVVDGGKLTALYLISAVDDLKYNETGLYLETTDKKTSRVVTSITYKNTATNKFITLKANTVFKSIGITGTGSEKNYLTYWEATNSDYFDVNTEGFTVLPYWITPDGITVKGISTRTITITQMTKTGISKVDG